MADDALVYAALGAANSSYLKTSGLSPVVAVEGDSRPAYGRWGQSSSWRGFTQWLQIYSGQRIRFPGALNTAVSGNNSTQILTRMPASVIAAKAAGAGAMFIVVGINDRIANFTLAQTMANVDAMLAICSNAQLPVVLSVDTTQGTSTIASTLTAQQQLIQIASREEYRKRNNPLANVYVVDVTPVYDDPLATTNLNLNAMVADGTHDQAIGSYNRAMSMMPVVNKLWAPVPFSAWTNNSSGYNAASNPRGCLTANPMVDGTGGVINASAPNATGQVATGWNFGANSLGGVLTAALSKVTKADGTVWQQAVISGSTGSTVGLSGYPNAVARMWFYQTISLANAPIGSTVLTRGQFEYDSGNSNVSSIIMGTEASLSGSTQYNELGYRGATVTSPITMPAGPWSFPPCANEPMTIPPTTTVNILRMGFEVELPSVAVSFTFRFRGVGSNLVLP